MALPKKTRFQRIVRELGNTARKRKVSYKTVIGAALSRWCAFSFPGLPQAGLAAPGKLQNDPAVIAFVDFIKVDELLEATYWFSSAYSQLAGEKPRKMLAMYFTPPSLTKRLLDDLQTHGVDFSSRSFCDPACGGAAFLAPIAMRMRDALRAKGKTPAQVLKHVERNLFGIDKDETLCKLSRHFLLMALHGEVIASGNVPRFRVIQGDSLLKVPDLIGVPDVVVCNPPFRKVSAVEAKTYSKKFSYVFEAQPNLYALFIALCVKMVATGGVCALVTPTSFLSGQYFSRLRTFLMAKTKVLSIGMVSDRLGVFIDVEQETALTLLRRASKGHVQSTTTEVSVVSKDGDYVEVGQCSLPNSGSVWPIPRTESDVALLRIGEKSRTRIVDYGYAIRVGSFVWNRDARPTYPSAKSAARAKGGAAVPLLWSSDIAVNGRLKFNGLPKANKEPSFVNLGSRVHRSVVRRPSVLLQRVTSNDQPKRLVAAVVPRRIFSSYGGFVGENHTVILEQIVSEPALQPAQMVKLLASPTIDRFFRCISGATNVSLFELSKLHLPDPKRLKDYLSQGCDIDEAARRALESQ